MSALSNYSPAEFGDSFAANAAESSGQLTGVLAVIAGTAAVAGTGIGLFLGGRWAVRKAARWVANHEVTEKKNDDGWTTLPSK